MKENQKECEYFEPVGDESCGHCHRFPPKNDDRGQSTIDSFPLLKKGCWCGEYKKKAKKKVTKKKGPKK